MIDIINYHIMIRNIFKDFFKNKKLTETQDKLKKKNSINNIIHNNSDKDTIWYILWI